jgi:tetratricopeptide (TPR) repeat protein
MRNLLLFALIPLLLFAHARAGQQPHAAEEFYRRGVERLQHGDADGALADLDRAIEMRPDYADAFFARSLAWDAKEKASDFPESNKARDASMADLNKAVALAPDRADFRKRRGVYMLRFADGPEAYNAIIADFTKAISLDPDDAQLYFLRSQVRVEVKDFRGALEDADRTVSLEPANAGYLNVRAWLKLVFLGDYAGAEEDAGGAIRLGGRGYLYEDYATRGKARLAQGKRAQAEQDFRECRRLDPRCERALEKIDMLMEKTKPRK